MSSALAIEFDPRSRPSTATLRLRGEASFRNAAELRQAVFEAITAAGNRNLVVSLNRLDRIDTTGMAVLLEALKETHDRGPDVYLVGASDSVRKVFELSGYEDALVRCYGCWGDFEQAVSA